MIPKGQYWTPEEDAQLAQLLKTLGTEAVAREMNRTPRSITARRRRLGLKVIVRGSAPDAPRCWTRTEEAKLCSLAETVTRAEAARILGRSPGSVRQKCYRFGLSWRAGYTSAAELAREFKIHETPVAAVLEMLFPEKKPSGPGYYWRLDDEEADRARVYLRKWKRRRAER